MKVYVVKDADEFYGVYSTKARAQHFIDSYPENKYRYQFHIKEVIVDEQETW